MGVKGELVREGRSDPLSHMTKYVFCHFRKQQIVQKLCDSFVKCYKFP